LNASVHLLRRVVPATVHIRSEIPEQHPSAEILGTERMGTGTVVSPSGLVLTAHYLLIGTDTVEVTLVDGGTLVGEVAGIDYASGLGVVKLKDGPAPRVAIRSIDEVQPGEEAFLVASVADGRRVDAGAISSIDAFEAFWEYVLDRAITVTVQNPGLGGGPLFDAHGSMVGVVALSLAEVGKFTLAVPASLSETVLDGVARQGHYSAATPRAWIGITCYTLRDHVVLAGIVPDGPGEQAGLKSGDVVLAIDGEEVHDRRALYERIWRHASGDVIRLKVFRSSTMRDVDVVAGNIEQFFS
jgi:S1-C subfamily serine protease